MKKLTLFSILILLVLLTAAWAPSLLPPLEPSSVGSGPRLRPKRSRRPCPSF